MVGSAFDFATVPACYQLVVGMTHARGGTLDVVIFNVPDLIRFVFVAPTGNSDHSSLLAVISISESDPNLCVYRKVFMKHQVKCNAGSALA